MRDPQLGVYDAYDLGTFSRTCDRSKYKEELFSSVGSPLLSMFLSILVATLGFWYIPLPLTRMYLACLSGLYPGTKLRPEQESVSLAGTLTLFLARDKSQNCSVLEVPVPACWTSFQLLITPAPWHHWTSPQGFSAHSSSSIPFYMAVKTKVIPLDSERCLWWEFNSNALGIYASPSWTPLQRKLSSQTHFGYLCSEWGGHWEKTWLNHSLSYFTRAQKSQTTRRG